MSKTFEAAVAQCLGTQWVQRASHKHRGGRNGQKGACYEDFFAALKLAELLVQHIDAPPVDPPMMQQQAEAFVDDLQVTQPDAQEHHYYQCKNVASLSWGQGCGSVAGDFEAQARVSSYMGQGQFTTCLVVPDPGLRHLLTQTMPSTITSHSEVQVFPYADGSLNRMVLEHPSIRDVLEKLAPSDAASDDVLVHILLVLGAAITKMSGAGDMLALLGHAQAVSPGMIRLMPWQMDGFALDPDFRAVLDRIEGLEYAVSRGFFHWKALGSSGMYPADCRSEEFSRFVRRVIRVSPRDFDAFEEQL